MDWQDKNQTTHANSIPKVLDLEGALTLDGIGILRESLVKALADSDNVVVKIENVTELALPVLQLLCSACRTALETNKSLAFGAKRPEAFGAAVRAAGYSRNKGCFPDRLNCCLWKEAGGE